MQLFQPMETFSCHQGLGRSLLAVSLREQRSEIVNYQSAYFNMDVRNCVEELLSATSDAAGMRGRGCVQIRMPPQNVLVGLGTEKWLLLQLKAFFSDIKVNTIIPTLLN